MNMWQHMDSAGSKLSIDVARWIKEFHRNLREIVKEHLGSKWRVTEIKEQSKTAYCATLITRTEPNPEYILAEIVATFDITAIENKPLDTIIDSERVAVPRKRLHCMATLCRDGTLRIINSTLDIPTGRG